MRLADAWWGTCALLALSVGVGCSHLQPATLIEQQERIGTLVGTPTVLSLPVQARELLPPAPHHGTYLMTHGPDQGHMVPYVFEPCQDHACWRLTKQGLVTHELLYRRDGAILIARETDLRTGRYIAYQPPIVLLPAQIDEATELSGASRVTVGKTTSDTVTHRGTCDWHLVFAGTQTIELPAGSANIYHVRLSREIDLSLARISLLVDFGYARDRGMVATTARQTVRVFGLFTEQEVWRLEQLLQ